MLLRVCSVIDHRRRQNVVKTTVTHSPAARVPLLCFYDILTSSVIYYWTDARQHGIYLLNKRSPVFFDWQFLCLTRLLVSLGSLSTNRKYPHSQKASWNDFHGPLGQKLLLPSRVSLTHPILPSVFLAPITSKGLLHSQATVIVFSTISSRDKPSSFSKWSILLARSKQVWQ